jgi:hypothetical protein
LKNRCESCSEFLMGFFSLNAIRKNPYILTTRQLGTIDKIDRHFFGPKDTCVLEKANKSRPKYCYTLCRGPAVPLLPPISMSQHGANATAQTVGGCTAQYRHQDRRDSDPVNPIRETIAPSIAQSASHSWGGGTNALATRPTSSLVKPLREGRYRQYLTRLSSCVVA